MIYPLEDPKPLEPTVPRAQFASLARVAVSRSHHCGTTGTPRPKRCELLSVVSTGLVRGDSPLASVVIAKTSGEIQGLWVLPNASHDLITFVITSRVIHSNPCSSTTP